MLNALDLELYDTIRAAFQMQLLSKRHAGPGVAELLAAARNGWQPSCTPEPEPSRSSCNLPSLVFYLILAAVRH